MPTVLQEHKAGNPKLYTGCTSAFLEKEMEEAASRIVESVHHAGAVLSEKLEDGKTAAERALKQGRHAFEDGVEEAIHGVRRHPVGALGIAFATGVALGVLVPRLVKK